MAEVRASTTPLTAFPAPSRRWDSTVAHISGLSLLVVAPGLIVSALVEWIGTGDEALALMFCGLLFAGLGAALYRTTDLGDLAPRTVFASVAWTWTFVSILGALPYVLAGTFVQEGVPFWVEWSDAIFESVSGYSCTGSTVLTTLPDLNDPEPQVGQGVLLYRQLTQWYGGMGFVQLVVAVLPALGTKALGFMGAEAPGPTAERLSPRAADTAKLLWAVYSGVTALIAVGYWIAGMRIFDAIAHALTTSATGGFALYNDSLGEFDSLPIEVVAQIGMLIGGCNYALHYLFIARDRRVYGRDYELRAFLVIIVVSMVAVVGMLVNSNQVGSFGTALRVGTFNVMSLATSTGFGNAQGSGSPGDFVLWTASPLVILLILMAIGGMSGSTAGGLKVIRLVVLVSLVKRFVVNSRQPRAVVPMKLGPEVIPEHVGRQIGTFIMAYLAIVVGSLVALTALGSDLEPTIAAVVGSLGNMGPAFGDAGPTATFQAAFNTPARLIIAFLMLAGRLELFAVLLMFSTPTRLALSLVPGRRIS